MNVPRGMGPVCSTPGCGAAAVLQWQRAGTDEELAAAIAGAQDRQDELWKTTRRHLMMDLLQRRDSADAVAARAAAGDPQAAEMLPVVQQAVVDAEAALDGQPAAAVVTVDSVAVAVLGCATHAVSPDEATRLHDPDCTDGSKCMAEAAAGKK